MGLMDCRKKLRAIIAGGLWWAGQSGKEDETALDKRLSNCLIRLHGCGMCCHLARQ